MLRRNRKQVLVVRVRGHLLRHGERRRGTVYARYKQRRVRRVAPSRPDVVVRRTRKSARSHAVQSDVRRALVYRTRRYARIYRQALSLFNTVTVNVRRQRHPHSLR